MYPGVGYLRVLRGEGRVSGGRYPGVYPTLSPPGVDATLAIGIHHTTCCPVIIYVITVVTRFYFQISTRYRRQNYNRH